MILSQIPSLTNQSQSMSWLQTIIVQILLKCVMLIRLFYCSRCSCGFDTFVHYDFPSVYLRWKFHNSQWERADMEASAARCCVVLQYAPFTALYHPPGFHPYPFSPFFIFQYKTHPRTAGQQLTTWIVLCVFDFLLKSHWIVQESVWFSVAFVLLSVSSHVFKIAWDLIAACGQH